MSTAAAAATDTEVSPSGRGAALRARRLAVLLVLAALACRDASGPGSVEVEPSPDPDALLAACEAAPPDEAICRRYLSAAWSAGALDAAAEVLARLSGERRATWVYPSVLGQLHLWQGEPDAARGDYREALERAETAGDVLGRGVAQFGLAVLEETFGSDEAAGDWLDRALDAARAAGDTRLTTAVLFRIAARHRGAGSYSAEIATWREILDLLGPGGNTPELRRTLFALAQARRRLGQLRDSRTGLEEVLRLSEASADTQHRAWATIELGLVELDADRPDRAADTFANAAEAAAAMGDVAAATQARILDGLAELRRGAVERAGALLTDALASTGPSDRELELRARLYLADVQRVRGAFDLAETGYLEAETLAEELRMPQERWEAVLGLAAAYRDRGDLDRAVESARRAVALVEDLREALSSGAERSHFLHTRSDAYQILASTILARDGSALGEAWDAVEQAHARTLRETLAGHRDGAPALAMDDRLGLDGVRALLGPGDLLVEFLLGEEQSTLIAVGARGATAHRLAPRVEIEGLVARYRSALERPLSSLDARLDLEGDFHRSGADGSALFDALLGPVRERVAAAERLIVVGDRKLHRLPFEALPESPLAGDGRPRFLGLRVAVEYLPAAALLDRGPAPRGGRVVAVVPGPASGADVPPPPRFAEDEIAAVVAGNAARRTVEVLRANDASEVLARLEREPAGVLHVAAHARLDPVLGPRILLPGGSIDAAAIAALPSAPELIVLSACETAEGELVGGEGVLGLVRAFTVAGSGQVVASLWPVDDRATATLMREFHAALAAGVAPSRALLDARRALAGDVFVHPYLWSGFAVYGADPPLRRGLP